LFKWTVIFGGLLLVGITFWQLYYQARQQTDEVIADDVTRLAHILRQIDETCKIINFKEEKTVIDFLNVVEFAGSDVGSMFLAHPERWQGPYLKENPSVQGIFYNILNSRQGYFVVPGDGVKLGNGMVIGKTLKLDKDSDIRTLMKDPKALFDKDSGKQLAAEIILSPTLADAANALAVE
jgi:hypothetical protein